MDRRTEEVLCNNNNNACLKTVLTGFNRLSRVPGGSRLNALLSGASTVKGPGPLKASTRSSGARHESGWLGDDWHHDAACETREGATYQQLAAI